MPLGKPRITAAVFKCPYCGLRIRESGSLFVAEQRERDHLRSCELRRLATVDERRDHDPKVFLI